MRHDVTFPLYREVGKNAYDLVGGPIKLMDTGDDFTGPVNIGNPGEFTIRQLAEKVIALTGSKSVIELRPLPGDAPMQRQPAPTLAREKLGWEPTTQLDEGLKRTIAYFEQRLSGHRPA
jgi:UDP-glucuronate decarboxylase